MISREFNLYLHAGHSIPLVINVNQYDHGEQWLFTLFNADGTQYVPSSGAIVGIKSDNLGIINTGSVDSQGRVVINETQQMTAAVGKAVFELLIDDQTHGTANFVVLVEPKPGDNADLSESDYSLFQQAIDGTSAAAIAQGVSDWMDDNLTPTTPVVDASLTVSGAAADAKKTGDELSDLKSQISQSTGMSADFKVALENLVSHVAFIGDDPTGQTYIDALHTAMYPPANLSHITAVYTQGSTVVHEGDSLDDLKADLVVTAYYDDSTSEVVTNYVLSGELTEGTSVITVTYGGKTATFSVTVSAPVFNFGVYVPTETITGSYIDENGDIQTATTNSGYFGDYIPVTRSSYWIGYLNAVLTAANGTYTGRRINWRVSEYDVNKLFIKQTHYSASEDNWGASKEHVFDTSTKYMRLGWYDERGEIVAQFDIENPATFTNLAMAVGSINGSTGADETNNKRIRSTDYISASETMSVTGCPWAESWTQYNQYGGYLFRCYDANKNIIGSLTDNGDLFHTNISNVELPTGTAYVRVLLSMGSSIDMTNFSVLINRLTNINGTKYWVTGA